jgi:predicted transcriptional regulator
MGGCYMIADSNSNIAWHRVQLKKNRDAVKALETARFTIGEIAGATGQTKKTIGNLKRKTAESERCIAAHERRTKRPVATDLQSLASVSWSSWNTRGVGRR